MVFAEPVVALVRGAGCVVKNALEGRKHWLMDPAVGKVTAIETVIAPTQFLAVLFNFSAVGQHIAGRAYGIYTNAAPTEAQWAQGVSLASAGGASPVACEVAKDALAAHFVSAQRKDWVMLCKAVIGIVFVLLTLLTLHVPYLAAVHWSLLFVEFALMYLINFMLNGVAKGWQTAGDKRRVAAALDAGTTVPVTPASLPLLVGPVCSENMPNAPWTSPQLPATDAFGTAAMREYVKAVQALEMSCTSRLKSAGTKTSVAAELRAQASADYATAVLDFVNMVLNMLACLGYAAYPITYFISESYLASVLPIWPGHAFVVYWGNMLGDVCWTIEPTLILTVPILIQKAAAVQRAADKKNQ